MTPNYTMAISSKFTRLIKNKCYLVTLKKKFLWQKSKLLNILTTMIIIHVKLSTQCESYLGTISTIIVT